MTLDEESYKHILVIQLLKETIDHLCTYAENWIFHKSKKHYYLTKRCLFIGSSRIRLKSELLHEENKFTLVAVARSARIKNHKKMFNSILAFNVCSCYCTFSWVLAWL